MDIVTLKSDKSKFYTVFQFVRMTEEEREKFRNNIVCSECGGDAYYRRPSKDGKIACFGAKHIGECNNSSSNNNESENGDKEVNEIEMETSLFEIKWNYLKSNIEKEDCDIKVEEENDRENIRRYVRKPSEEKSAKISLKQILEFSEFNIIKDQDYSLIIGEKEVFLKDVVCKLEEVDERNINKYMFYWGKISSFNNTWLSTRYPNKISILIEDKISEKFWRAYDKKILKIIKNNMIIIFGKVLKSAKGNLYIKLYDTKHCYIKKTRLEK